MLHVEAGIAEARARMRREGTPDSGPATCPVHQAAGEESATVRRGTARGGGGLNEITAPVINDLGRRVTTAPPGG
jgi:hypothetical protein